MNVLAIRTDKPEAELYVYADGRQLLSIKWAAHLKLAETIHSKIEEILNKSSISYDSLDGIAVFKGPGSFTGLRIGISVANALAFALDIPVAASRGEKWVEQALKKLADGGGGKLAMPEYGAPARTTKARK